MLYSSHHWRLNFFSEVIIMVLKWIFTEEVCTLPVFPGYSP